MIATNHHVVEGHATVDVQLQDDTRLIGKVVYTDRRSDLAIVKVDGMGFPYLPLADMSEVRVGETVIAIGNPQHGIAHTVTKGVVSAIGPGEGPDGETLIQTDASINFGNSGGPLINSYGEVVGVNTWIARNTNDPSGVQLQGINFAISSSDVVRALGRFSPEDKSSLPDPPTKETGQVKINSEPAGAEILVDGKFVGQTPSTIPLEAGPHNVVIKLPGRKDWQRELNVTKDSQLTLHSQLELQP